jgi:hypothetical protein
VSQGNVLTLTVNHRVANVVYPVVAGVGWEGGFQTEVATVQEPDSEHPDVEGDPALLEVNVSAPIVAPTNEPGEEASASSGGTRLKKNWGVSFCAPLGLCGVWKNRFRGYFYYDYSEAWYPTNRQPGCIPSWNGNFSLEITECSWVGPNHQKYGNGYHITARTQWEVTEHNPSPFPDITSHKAATGRAYGSGNIYFHKGDDICNPNWSCVDPW